MGRRAADRPEWFDNDEPVDPETESMPVTVTPIPEEPAIEQTVEQPVKQEFGTYQPQSHTGTDYAYSRRQVRWEEKPKRKVSEQTLAIMFGAAIGFFIAGIVYISMWNVTANEAYRGAALVFSGTGVVLSGIVIIGIATVHMYRTRKDG